MNELSRALQEGLQQDSIIHPSVSQHARLRTVGFNCSLGRGRGPPCAPELCTVIHRCLLRSARPRAPEPNLSPGSGSLRIGRLGSHVLSREVFDSLR